MGKLTWMKRGLSLILSGVLLTGQPDLTAFATEMPEQAVEFVTVDEGTVKEAEITKPQAPDTAKAESVTWQSVTLSWSRVSGADGYTIYRKSAQESAYTLLARVENGQTLKYIDNNGLVGGRIYSYRIYAYVTYTEDGVVKYAESEDMAVVTATPALLAAPKLSGEAIGTTTVKLTWDKIDMPAQNSGYNIYQMTGQTEKIVKTCANTENTCTIGGLSYGVQYTFLIKAYVKDESGNIILGEGSNLFTIKTKLKAVTIQSVELSKNSGLTVKWKYTDSAEEDTYLIYRSTKKGSGYKKIATVSKKAGAKKGTYTDNKVTLGQKYFYKILCKKNINGKTVKSDYSKPVGAKAVPAVPKLVVNSYGVSSVKLSWNKIKGNTSNGYVNGYQIYRSTSKNGTFKKVATINSGTTISYVDTGLTTGSVYYYKIRAFGKLNNKAVCGGYSDVKSVKVVPGQVSVKATAVDYTTVRISWGTISGCAGYKIYRADTQNGKYKLIKKCGSDKTSYEDKKVKTGNTYYYKVRAYAKKNGKTIHGAYSKVVSAVPILNKPTGLQAIILDSSQVKLIWNAVPGAETYTILRATSATGKYKVASEICTTNSFIDANITGGNTYYYKVYAVRGEFKSEMTDYVTAVSATLELSTDKIIVKVGGSVKVTATAKPAANIIWSSSDPSIALVTTDGTIYGVKLGTTVIKATANGITKSVAVTVSDKVPPKGLEIYNELGTVDFNAVKAAGYDYVMIRTSKGSFGDTSFGTNYTKAKAAGLKVGVYHYAEARTVDEAKQEAARVLETIKDCKLDYPVVYEMDKQELLYGLTAAERNNIIDAFRGTIAASGKSYKFALHTTYEWLTKYLDNSRLAGMDLWVTNYKDETAGHGYTGNGNVVMWCYTKNALVSGVSGKVKVSISYYTN